jgi:regulator of replication initiation timing
MKPIEQIGQIKQKVQGLLKKQVTLEKENEKLRTELDRKVRLEQE